MKAAFFAVFAISLISGCQSNNSVVVARKYQLHPANDESMKDVRRLAVVSVNGQSEHLDKSQVAGQMNTYLGDIKVADHHYFNLVDDRSADALISAEYAVKIRTGGSIDMPKACIEKPALDGDKAEYKTKCEVDKTAPRICSKRKVTVTFTPKVISAQSGSLIYSETYASSKISVYCDTGTSSHSTMSTTAILANDAFKSVLRKFAEDIAPHYKVTDIPLITKDKSNLTGDQRSLFYSAIDEAKKGQMTLACRKFAQEAPYLADSPAIMYNVGVCWEAQGNNEFALGYYQKAMAMVDKLSGKDEALVKAAIKRSLSSCNSSHPCL